jgi:hypothetical protein
MQGKIVRVVHRHSDLKEKARDLVLEVGQPLPPFYQEGRRRGLRVTRIDGVDPVVCTLSDGDAIYIGGRSVCAITREGDNAKGPKGQ